MGLKKYVAEIVDEEIGEMPYFDDRKIVEKYEDATHEYFTLKIPNGRDVEFRVEKFIVGGINVVSVDVGVEDEVWETVSAYDFSIKYFWWAILSWDVFKD